LSNDTGSFYYLETAMNYIAIIHKDADSDFGVSFPDFPGYITAGRTLDEAKDMAREALTGHIHKAGEPIPDPSPLDEVMTRPDFQDGVAFLPDRGRAAYRPPRSARKTGSGPGRSMRHSNLPSFMCRKFLQSCQSCDNTSKLGEIDKTLIM
jgi:predicted RNase H-like HicB family nuclease